VKAVEDLEELVMILHVETDAIAFDVVNGPVALDMPEKPGRS